MSQDAADFAFLFPILHSRNRVPDLEALRTWYEAVSDALQFELPHDLFALWVYSPNGEPSLIAPEELAADDLRVPRPNPFLDPHELARIEDRVQSARYGSVICRPIRHGPSDVGLLLIAGFRPDLYGMREVAVVESAAEAMAPMLARYSRAGHPSDASEEPITADASSESEVETIKAPPAIAPLSAEEQEARELNALYSSLAEATTGAGTPRDFMLAVSFAIQQLLPHDGIELIIGNSPEDQHYRLGLHGHGPLWADPSLVLASDAFDPKRLFGGISEVLVRDGESDSRGPMPELAHVAGGEEKARSLIGVQLRVVERPVGYLLLGSAGPGLYEESDLMLLDTIGALIAPRVDVFVMDWQQQVLRGQFDMLRHIPMHLSRIAEELATTPLLGEATRRFVKSASELLPVNAIEFAVRLSNEGRVAVVKPGQATPLADLPQEPIEGTGVARVVRGEIPYLVSSQDSPPLSVLVVPLRVGGTIIGAMAMTSPGTTFGRTDLAVAQQLADLVAPHFEVARRVASTPLFVPGWKRSTF
ncbi:MAG TPA: GAF domain-containing protein [Gemmatimonadales bacterium]|nr:GAF domain-containing protein [Gemmatimonadales bacterium]